MEAFWLNYTTRLTQLTTSKKRGSYMQVGSLRAKRSGSKSRLVLKSSKETLLHCLWRYQEFKVLLYKQLVVGMWASTPSCWYPSADVWIEHIKAHLFCFQGVTVLWIHWTVELITSRCWGNSRGLSKHSQTSYSQFMSLHFIFVLFLELDLQHVSNKRTKWHTEIEEQKLLVF